VAALLWERDSPIPWKDAQDWYRPEYLGRAARICALFEGAGGLRAALIERVRKMKLYQYAYSGTELLSRHSVIMELMRPGEDDASPPPADPGLDIKPATLEAINANLDLQGALYDADLLPEEIRRVRERDLLEYFVAGYMLHAARTPPQKPAETTATHTMDKYGAVNSIPAGAEARREIARRFSGPEGDAAAEETKRIVSRWKGAGENGDTAETPARWAGCAVCGSKSTVPDGRTFSGKDYHYAPDGTWCFGPVEKQL
jgi:hypothetical protein